MERLAADGTGKDAAVKVEGGEGREKERKEKMRKKDLLFIGSSM